MILNIVLISVIVVLTAGMIAAFAIDYKRAKAGKKSFLWERKSDTRPDRDTQTKD